MARRVSLYALLLVIWLAWSGVPDWDGEHVPLTVVFGAASCALVVWMVRRMEVGDLRGTPAMVWVRHSMYLPWLVKEIVVANLHVARVILSPRPLERIRPRLVRVRGSQRTDLGKTIFANSLTLTPGTVTLDVRDGMVLVHALTEHAARHLLDGEMDRRVAALEGPP